MTLVKFTSKEYLWRKPYPIDCITFQPCRHLSHTLAKSDVVSAPPLLSVMKLLYLKATVLFLQSWSATELPFACFRQFSPFCPLLCYMQVFFKIPSSSMLVEYFVKRIKTGPLFLLMGTRKLFHGSQAQKCSLTDDYR